MRHTDKYYDKEARVTDYDTWLKDFVREAWQVASDSGEVMRVMEKYEIWFKQR